ncbi:MAG: thioredoxin family protein [Betaproteobacteria bacterium]|jgi:thioredoxin-related protein
MRLRPLPGLAFALALFVAPIAQGADMPAGIKWVDVKAGGSVDAAFAQAKRENRPLFLYWGAVWCPPCNQVKATVFSRQDFIERARHFIPVYIDGDAPAAQQLGSRFKVSGYPTTILFRPDGTEVTRLPAEVDGERYMQALAQGMSGKPVKALLARAQAGKPLSPTEWQQLAFHSWDVDMGTALPRDKLPAVLWDLARRSNTAAPEASARLAMQAVRIAAGETADKAAPFDKGAGLQRVRAVLAAPPIARANLTELAYGAERVPPFLTEAGAPQRAQLLREWDRALVRLVDDGGLSRMDRVMAANARVNLARVEVGKGPVPVELQTQVRGAVMTALRDVKDPFEREALSVAAASALADAGLAAEADAVARAQMERSATPYYHMRVLAALARERGDTANALAWSEKAYASAKGPATRLEWGAGYLRSLITLAPAQSEKIERTARSILSELEPKPETFHGRNRAILERAGRQLNEWNKDGKQDAVLARLRTQLGTVCTQLPAQAPERATCNGLLTAKAA